MKIKFVDLTVDNKEYQENYEPLIKKCIINGNFVGGNEVESFENEFSKFCGSKYAVSLNSGTDALYLSLLAMGIQKGDEVITVANSFMATVNAIKLIGAKPVLVDISNDMLIDVKKIEKSITNKTKAIIPVHLSGLVCQMDKIIKLSKKYNLKVIEDAAQSIGSKYKNKKAGTFGDTGCFSLHPLKNLAGIGDGGIVITDDKTIYHQLLLLRNHGMINRDVQKIVGYNSRLDTINASILRYKLTKLNDIIKKRRKNAKLYLSELKKVKGIVLPIETKNDFHTYHTFVIQTSKRNELMKYLLKHGIETKIHYPISTHKQEPYNNDNNLKITEKSCDSILSLPIGHVSKKEIVYISKIIKKFK